VTEREPERGSELGSGKREERECLRSKADKKNAEGTGKSNREQENRLLSATIFSRLTSFSPASPSPYHPSKRPLTHPSNSKTPAPPNPPIRPTSRTPQKGNGETDIRRRKGVGNHPEWKKGGKYGRQRVGLIGLDWTELKGEDGEDPSGNDSMFVRCLMSLRIGCSMKG
jgi:hypothetical protein